MSLHFGPRSARASSPKRGRLQSRRAIRVSTCATMLVALLVGATFGQASLTASATVPGTPGTPQAGTPVYTENFSNQNATLAALPITTYVGGAAAANNVYTADIQWTPAGQQCNGWILHSTTPLPLTDLGCVNNQPSGWQQIRDMAVALGTAQGQTPAQALTNQVLSEYTNAASGVIAAGTQFRTTRTIPAIGGHYYAVSAYFAATSCPAAGGANQPKETFSLIVNGSPIVLSQGLNPCSNNTFWGPQVKKLQSAAYQVPVGATANLGLSLYNATASGSGNDAAFDLPQIVDVTPQLDKAFNPTLILNGGSSKMTLTVTNTSDLMAKTDWFITDALPANLKIAAVPNIGGTCVQRAGAAYTVNAPAGGTNVSVTGGDLGLNEASCTITIDVTSSVNGTYINGPANITTNLNPPANATLEVIQPSIDLVKTSNISNYDSVGDIATYTFVATNTTPKAPTNTTLNTSLSNVVITEDSFSGLGDMSALVCDRPAPVTLESGQKLTCTATYVVQQGDLDNAPLTNVARTTGTPATGPNVTDTDDEIIPAIWTPELLLDKTSAVVDVDGDGVTGLDDHIMYEFDVTNTGNISVTNVTIDDDLLSQLNISVTCTPTTLAPDEVAHCVADAPYVVTQQDVDAQMVINTAISHATDPDGGPVTSNEDSTETPISIFRIPLQIEKIGESTQDNWVRMDGSSFAILEDVNGAPGDSLALPIVDVETGLFQIDDLEAGTYWLSELTAPDGFSLLAEPVQFTINSDRTVSILTNGGDAVSAAGQLITVRDVPALVMPEAGGPGTSPYLLGGLGLLIVAVGLAWTFRRRTGALSRGSLM